MKKIFLLLVVLLSTFTFAQNKSNIVISKRYDFQKSENSFNINNMLKGILNSSFNVYFDSEELPIEIAQNRCDAFYGYLVDNSNMFSTKLKFVVKDCQNNVVFESIEVKSKEKDYQNAYNETLRLLAPEVKKFATSSPKIKKETPVVVETKVVEVKPIENKLVENKTIEIKSDASNTKHKLIEMTNGFAVMDANQKIVLQIYITSNPKVFIADKFGVKGVFTILENGTRGFFEYYMNDKLIGEEYSF